MLALDEVSGQLPILAVLLPGNSLLCPFFGEADWIPEPWTFCSSQEVDHDSINLPTHSIDAMPAS
jgi:hypothetical protein